MTNLTKEEMAKRDKRIYQAYLNDLQNHGEVSWDRIREQLPDIALTLSRRRMRAIASREYHISDYESELREEMADLHIAEEHPPEDNSVTLRIEGDTAVAHSNNPQIKTLAELIEHCGVDLELWEVKNWLCNAWGMGRKNKKVNITWENGVITGNVDDTGGWAHLQNFQVKAWFVPRVTRPVELAIADIMKDLALSAPDYSDIEPLEWAAKDGYLMVPSLFDAHFGKRSSVSIDRAEEEYKKVIDATIAKTLQLGMPVSHILYIVGQDMLNADTLKDTTTHGTWVENSVEMQTAVDVSCRTATYAVERYAKIAPVTVMVVPGNHDRYGVYWLGKYIEGRFVKHPRIKIVHNHHPRKYFKYGSTMLGVDHGDKMRPQDLALTMAVEDSETWATTSHREWLRGHFHKKTEMYHSITTEKGITVKIMPALCPPDAWHILHGFIGNHRAAEVLFYHVKNGPAGTFPVFVDELK